MTPGEVSNSVELMVTLMLSVFPGIHIECKRTEAFRLYDALAQAKADAKAGSIPVVVHRKNNSPWVVVMTLDDFMRIYEQDNQKLSEVTE